LAALLVNANLLWITQCRAITSEVADQIGLALEEQYCISGTLNGFRQSNVDIGLHLIV